MMMVQKILLEVFTNLLLLQNGQCIGMCMYGSSNEQI